MDNQKPPSPNQNKPDKDTKSWLLFSGMAFEMFIVIGIFTAIGHYADKKLNTAPLLLIVLLLVGVVVSFYNVYKQLSQ
ncbi:MAG: putative F0F1-ATPase subunit Ca2+/Mg2+ transporter [Bacteroidota bacterium]|jgi:F0F1-type ATP synthase assembly protein I